MPYLEKNLSAILGFVENDCRVCGVPVFNEILLATVCLKSRIDENIFG